MPNPLPFGKLICLLAVVCAAVTVVPIGARAQSLPAGWSLSDIGKPPAPGSATQSAGTFSVSSRGWDVSGTSDQFTFVSTPLSGNLSIVARVSSLQTTNAWSLAGLMIRQSLSPGAREASLFVTPGNGLVIRARSSAGGGTVQMSVGAGGAPMWLRLDRRASTVKAYRSSDGTTWTQVASLKLPLSSGVVVGLAVASHSTSASVAASITRVSVNGTPVPLIAPAPNSPPFVSLNAPAGGSTFGAPATIAIGATAADSDGTVAKVEFYAGTTRLATDTASPYTFSWSNVPAGSYALKAVATDNAGATATSTPVSVTVASNKPPFVSLTAPLTGTAFAALSAIALTATASDPDGSIQRVEFYRGSTLLGTDTTSPYTFNWLSVPIGSYSLSAVARDNLGATTVSTWSDITVGATTMLSTAIFAPAVTPYAIDYYLFEIFTAGSNPATAAPVRIQNLGLPAPVNGEIVADVRNTISVLPPGSYIATVSAMDAVEGKLSSAPFAFTR